MIEALRSGVPNRDAVRELGSSQHAIELRFSELLDDVAKGEGNHGLLVGGDFGTGKSHLLENLQHVALDRGFVTSKVVVSKESPLYDPVKVYRTAVTNAMVPNHRGSAIAEIARGLDFDSDAFRDLSRWVDSDEARLNERFGATLYLYKDLHDEDEEFAERILRFWSGDPLLVGDIKRRLRDVGEAATWPLSKVTVRDLALQRFRFAGALMKAAGYGGWILLFDEVELIGRYSSLQRGKSYGEVARWISGFADEGLPWLGSVLAVSDDLRTVVVDEKNDDENIPMRLRARKDELGAARAEKGITVIRRNTLHLERPDLPLLEETYRTIRKIHGTAYDWSAPELRVELGEQTKSMRQYVRAWIYEWDLRRLDPAYRPNIQIGVIAPEYGEERELEAPADEAPDADNA
jgi:P-loop Domain of unknown function (DUF2791)